VSDKLAPSTRYLKERAAHYRALAAKERNPARAADYLDRAQILEKALEPAPSTPAKQADSELTEKHVREGCGSA